MSRKDVQDLLISIHTLAWRVTLDISRAGAVGTNFNPHPRVEGDYTAPLSCGSSSDFNPHPRVEGDSDLNTPVRCH